MKRLSAIVLAVTVLYITNSQAQILSGDAHFEVVNQLQWQMTGDEVRDVCRKRGGILLDADSTVSFRITAFGCEARGKIQFEKSSHKMLAINLSFAETTKGIRDSLISYFTASLRRKPILTTKEKSVIIFTIKMETASWTNGKDGIHVISMLRGDEVLGVTLVLMPFAKEKPVN